MPQYANQILFWLGFTNLQRRQKYSIIFGQNLEILTIVIPVKDCHVFFFLSEKMETHQKTPSNQDSATSSKTSKEEEKVTEVGKEE